MKKTKSINDNFDCIFEWQLKVLMVLECGDVFVCMVRVLYKGTCGEVAVSCRLGID